MRNKLEEVRGTLSEVVLEENKFEAKQAKFEDEDRVVANQRDELKRVRDKYCTEKVQFDRQAEEVKEQAE